jgi:hypothetical protein
MNLAIAIGPVSANEIGTDCKPDQRNTCASHPKDSLVPGF